MTDTMDVNASADAGANAASDALVNKSLGLGHLDPSRSSSGQRPLIAIKDLKTYFPIKAGFISRTVGYVKAVDGVSLSINAGKTLGLVGESGCGKTTLGRTVLRLVDPMSGQILYGDEQVDIAGLSQAEMRKYRQKMQIVFQDPYSSLNPRMTVEQLLTEILRVHKQVSAKEAHETVAELLRKVGLSALYAVRYPHEFSGGQRQRIAIARAIALNPEFVVCDEPVSALDVSIQSQILNLLMDLKEELGMTYLFVSHALNVVEHISDQVAVMYLGKLVETAATQDLFANPVHPYTQALLSAVPRVTAEKTGRRIILEGDVPSPSNIPAGCRFRTRCWKAGPECGEVEPELKDVGAGHMAACHRP